MKKTNNIIKINGQHFDANTGLPLSAPKSASQTISIAAKATKEHLSSTVNRSVKNVRSHAPQPSRTLMRSALKKPVVKPIIKTQAATTTLVKQPKYAIKSKLSIPDIDNQRLKHALVIPKSKLISHFNGNFLKPNTEEAEQPLTPAMASIKLPKFDPNTKPDFLQSAIDKATSHQQPPHKPRLSKKHKIARRIARIGGAGFGVAILVGIVGYQNISNLQIRLAANKAGFAASLPAYQPTGFKLGDVSSSAGQVAIKFKDGTDVNNNYTLVEKVANFNSLALRDGFVANNDKNYRTEEVKGQEVYLYGSNNATWVKGNIWYIVTGNGSLSDTQLFNLVASL